MRKLPCKWPFWLSLIGFSQPILYVFFRIGKPEIFSSTEFAQKFFGAAFISMIVWAVYGIICLLVPSRTVIIEGQKVPKSCENCKFSEKTPQTSMDDIPDPKEMKCHLTGYNYEATYTCSKWKSRE